MATAGSENRFPKVRMVEGAAPATPASGEIVVYAKSDGLLYWKDDAGAEYAPDTGGGAAAHIADATDAHDASAVSADTTGYGNSAAADVQSVLDDFDAAITAAAGGAAATLPVLTDRTSAYEASDTSTVVTTAAYAIGASLIAVVYSTGRGANSITQTNVTWTKRYDGNGGSQYLQVWTGVVAGGAAGTSATVAFTGANKNFIEIAEYDGPAITAATLSGSSVTATGTLVSLTSGALADGDLVLWAVSANSPASAYHGANVPFAIFGAPYGGAGRGGLMLATTDRVAVWSISASSVAYFGAVLVLT